MAILDLFRLDDRVVVITGASSGLGVAFAQACAEAGADVVLAARRVDGLEQTAELVRDLGRRALTIQTDVSDVAQCARLANATMNEFSRLDVLVNNAGIATAVPASRETPEQFRRVFDVNLFGAYWTAQQCAAIMSPGGSIINVSSILALTTGPLPQAAYSASKAALLGLTRDLARQWGSRRGIRVNALAPGFFKSEITDSAPPGYLDQVANRQILGRMGDPVELASTLVWLASAAGGYVTGETIVVDGGVIIS